MNPSTASFQTRLKVGLFMALGVIMLGVTTVMVNDKPFWWRPCHLVFVNVEDATGLKYKSPVRSLGLQIGYIRSVDLVDNRVRLGICVTAPVEITEQSRAYMRGEGFLGDQFLELKPVKSLHHLEGPGTEPAVEPSSSPMVSPSAAPAQTSSKFEPLLWAWNQLIPSAAAEDGKSNQGQEVPVGKDNQSINKLVEKVNDLVGEMTQLTSNIKKGIDPEELRQTMQQLNHTLENASKTLSPEGNLTTTARRALSKLEDSIEQLRQIMTRVNEGKGSLGMLINDPSYADEIRLALKNLNKFLNKASEMRFVVDVGGEVINGVEGTRGWAQLAIWPNPTRYYLLGIAADPRGTFSSTSTTTEVGGSSTTVNTVQTQKGGFTFTAMLGKRLLNQRVDLALGVLYGDAAGSLGFQLGPTGDEDLFRIVTNIYGRSYAVSGDIQTKIDGRANAILKVFSILYLRGGLDSFRKQSGKTAYSYGGGVTFDDEDIKILFSFK